MSKCHIPLSSILLRGCGWGGPGGHRFRTYLVPGAERLRGLQQGAPHRLSGGQQAGAEVLAAGQGGLQLGLDAVSAARVQTGGTTVKPEPLPQFQIAM